MHPVLVELPAGARISSLAALAVAGIVSGIVVAVTLSRREGLDHRRVLDAALWSLLGGLVGAKALALLASLGAEQVEPWVWVDLFGRPRRLPRALTVFPGGLSFFGGVAGGLVAVAACCRRGSLPFGRVADVLATALAVGHPLGLLGCFLAGSCFGKAGGGALGVSYGSESEAFEAHAAAGLLLPPLSETYPLHPVQLYAAALGLAMAAAVLVMRPWRRFGGQIAIGYLSAASVAWLALDVYRGDRTRGFVGDPVPLPRLNDLVGVDGGSPSLLSVPQLAALVTVLACAWVSFLFLHARSRSRRA